MQKKTNKHPIFAPTKGRYDYPYTIRLLQRMGLYFYIVTQTCEYDNYVKLVHIAQSLQKQHPDCVSIKWKWNSFQHQVNQRSWRNNRLIRKYYDNELKNINLTFPKNYLHFKRRLTYEY